MMYIPPVNKKPVHLVKNYHDVPEKQRHAEPLGAQEKIDGCYAYSICKSGTGNGYIYSRTGERCYSLSHLREELMELAVSRKFKPFVAIFEVHVPGWPVNKISGAFRKQSKPFTEAVARIHDVIPYDDFCAGRCEIPYKLRYATAVRVAECLESFEVVPLLDMVDTQEEAEAFAESCIKLGWEGAVFKRMNGIWIAGKKDANQMKIKQGVSYDLEVVGMEEGKGKYKGTLGKLLCGWRRGGVADGKFALVKCSGMTDEQREQWWPRGKYIESKEGEQLSRVMVIDGPIVKVDGMCLTPDGMIREPRFKEVREDKVIADV